MPEFKYNKAIKITSLQGYDYKTAKEMKTGGKEFIEMVKKHLDTIYEYPIGKQLIKEIGASGKEVLIFNADAGNGSVAKPYPPTVENEMDRFVLLRQIPNAAIDKLKKEGAGKKIREARFYSAEFLKVIKKSKVKIGTLSVILNMTFDDIARIALEDNALTETQYVRFAMYMYPYLTRGAGCGVQLRYEEAQGSQTPIDTPEIVLAHELMHAWRMVRGERIFEGGWEEEAMTVGLPPFTNMGISENKLRRDMDLQMRENYSALCRTSHMQVVSTFKGDSTGTGSKGIWPEQLAAYDRWKAKNADLVKKYEKSRAKGKGFFKKRKDAERAQIAHLLYNAPY